VESLHVVFGFVCHQMPARSPQMAELVFPLCFRCAGLHLGLFASYAFLAATGGFDRRLPGQWTGIGASLLLLPILLDGWANGLALWSSAGWLRAATGTAAGVALPLLLTPLAVRPDVPADALRPTLSRAGALLLPLAAGGVLVLPVTYPVSALLFRTAGAAALAGLLLFILNIGRAAAALAPLRTGRVRLLRSPRASRGDAVVDEQPT
jgi:uncharacterized membrane protein